MNSAEIAKKLQREANTLLFDKGYDQLFKQYGDVIYTGSYALELMAWPDIDMQLVMKDSENIAKASAMLLAELAKRPDVWIAKLGKNMHLQIPQMPQGTYIGLKIAHGDGGQLFKLDIWMISEAERIENKRIMDEIRAALTEDKKRLILDMKQRFMTDAGRTPSLSGYHLYQAVLFKGLQREDEIRSYLRENGVKSV
jgi:hypothetical protein